MVVDVGVVDVVVGIAGVGVVLLSCVDVVLLLWWLMLVLLMSLLLHC